MKYILTLDCELNTRNGIARRRIFFIWMNDSFKGLSTINLTTKTKCLKSASAGCRRFWTNKFKQNFKFLSTNFSKVFFRLIRLPLVRVWFSFRLLQLWAGMIFHPNFSKISFWKSYSIRGAKEWGRAKGIGTRKIQNQVAVGTKKVHFAKNNVLLFKG